MKNKMIIGVFTLIIMLALTACTSNSSLDISEKQQMVEHVKMIEENEFDLMYFNKSYALYYKVVNGLVSEQYWKLLRDEIVFGYDDVTYTRNDLATMSQEDYEKHKEHMLRLIRGVGMDMEKLSVTLNISDVYTAEQSNQANIYILENKELNGALVTTTTKKYTLEKQSGKWLIIDVAQDKITYESQQTKEEMEERVKGLKYQSHDGNAIGYPSVAVLSEVREE